MFQSVIDDILNLAAVDPLFCQEVLKDAVTAAQSRGFKLTPYEQGVLSAITAYDLQEFCQIVFARLYLS